MGSVKEVTLALDDDNMVISSGTNSGTSLRNTYFAAFSALTYISGMGLVAGYTSSATVDMKKLGSRFIDITPEEISWIVSLPNLAGIFGNFLAGFLSQRFGRKGTLMLVSVGYLTSWLTIVYASSVAMLYVGRLIAGFSCAMATVTVPSYVVEISTTELRGFLSAGFQVFYSIGVLIIMSLGVTLRWSWLALSAGVFVTLSAYLMLMMPESPAWLVRESRNLEAVRSLKFLRGNKANIPKEIQEISDNMAENSMEGFNIREFLRPTLYKPMIVVILLFFFSQLSGMAVLITYTVDIFQNEGSYMDARVAATIVAVVQLVATMFTSVLIDRAGRKFLFISSGIVIFFSLAVLGVYSILQQKYGFDMHNFKWIPLLSFVLYIAAYSFGFGPIPFVMTPELVPIHTRSVLLAVGTLTCSLTAFAVAKTFDSLSSALGVYGVYLIYAVSSLSGSVFCYFFTPETKGRSILDINKSFDLKGTE